MPSQVWDLFDSRPRMKCLSNANRLSIAPQGQDNLNYSYLMKTFDGKLKRVEVST